MTSCKRKGILLLTDHSSKTPNIIMCKRQMRVISEILFNKSSIQALPEKNPAWPPVVPFRLVITPPLLVRVLNRKKSRSKVLLLLPISTLIKWGEPNLILKTVLMALKRRREKMIPFIHSQVGTGQEEVHRKSMLVSRLSDTILKRESSITEEDSSGISKISSFQSGWRSKGSLITMRTSKRSWGGHRGPPHPRTKWKMPLRRMPSKGETPAIGIFSDSSPTNTARKCAWPSLEIQDLTSFLNYSSRGS